LDHKDRNPSNNRISNLREATSSQNTANSKKKNGSRNGLRGTELVPSGSWQARINSSSKKAYLGTFDTPEEAHAAWCKAAKAIYGEFFYAGNDSSTQRTAAGGAP
jgi:HNH endonuclease